VPRLAAYTSLKHHDSANVVKIVQKKHLILLARVARGAIVSAKQTDLRLSYNYSDRLLMMRLPLNQ
jgi:hypothetical protein